MPISILHELDMCMKNTFAKNPKTKNMISDLKLRYFHLNNMINLRKLIVPNCTASQFGKYANTILRELDMCMKNTFAKNPKTRNMISDLKLRYSHLNNMVNMSKFIVPYCTALQFWNVCHYKIYVS